MMPFERMNGIVKGYVRNRDRPDGSIIRGFLTEEGILFCTNYLEIVKSIGVPVNKHDGRLEGVGHSTLKEDLHVDYNVPSRHNDFDRAHMVVLRYLQVVDPWVTKHKQIIKQSYDDRGQHRSDDQILREQNIHFASWFKREIKERSSPKQNNAKLMYALSNGPTCNLATYQVYDINGYTFYTKAKDKNSEYQNSRVNRSLGCEW
jgi:hypothetical protein